MKILPRSLLLFCVGLSLGLLTADAPFAGIEYDALDQFAKRLTRPVQYGAWYLLHQVSGTNSLGFHLFYSVLLGFLGVAVDLFLREIEPRKPRVALTATLLFLTSSAVPSHYGWMMAAQPLALPFFFGAMVALLRKKWRFFIPLAAAAMLSDTISLVFLPSLAALHLLVSGQGSLWQRLWTPDMRRVLLLVPLVLVTLAVFVGRGEYTPRPLAETPGGLPFFLLHLFILLLWSFSFVTPLLLALRRPALLAGGIALVFLTPVLHAIDFRGTAFFSLESLPLPLAASALLAAALLLRLQRGTPTERLFSGAILLLLALLFAYGAFVDFVDFNTAFILPVLPMLWWMVADRLPSIRPRPVLAVVLTLLLYHQAAGLYEETALFRETQFAGNALVQQADGRPGVTLWTSIRFLKTDMNRGYVPPTGGLPTFMRPSAPGPPLYVGDVAVVPEVDAATATRLRGEWDYGPVAVGHWEKYLGKDALSASLYLLHSPPETPLGNYLRKQAVLEWESRTSFPRFPLWLEDVPARLARELPLAVPFEAKGALYRVLDVRDFLGNFSAFVYPGPLY